MAGDGAGNGYGELPGGPEVVVTSMVGRCVCQIIPSTRNLRQFGAQLRPRGKCWSRILRISWKEGWWRQECWITDYDRGGWP